VTPTNLAVTSFQDARQWSKANFVIKLTDAAIAVLTDHSSELVSPAKLIRHQTCYAQQAYGVHSAMKSAEIRPV
jgi:hypothetical protein